MEKYQELVENTLLNSTYKPNRTGIDTISNFSYSYKIDVSDRYPLLTTKDLSGGRWESLTHEFIWYLSGQEHIKELREHTKIWDKWATEDGMLDTAYGRFWRKYPTPKEEHRFEDENWVQGDEEWVNEDGTVDQLEYVTHLLNNSPNSRRMVVTAWHPANSTNSTLPPCHFTYVINVQDGKINTHLTQRSADIAVGVPFNIAAYSLLTRLLAQQTGFEIGEFSHTLVDAHIYVGGDERGGWYGNNLSEVQEIYKTQGPTQTLEFIENNAPPQKKENEDHLPNLLEQLTREPRELPKLDINASATINDIKREDIHLYDYDPHPSLQFYVAE